MKLFSVLKLDLLLQFTGRKIEAMQIAFTRVRVDGCHPKFPRFDIDPLNVMKSPAERDDSQEPQLREKRRLERGTGQHGDNEQTLSLHSGLPT